MRSLVKNIFPALLTILLFPFEACVEQVTPVLTENDSESVLVVEGQLTSEEGPFRVKLTTSVSANVSYSEQPVLGADVQIMDDKGNIYQLTGDHSGKYETADKHLRGIPGNTYTLTIRTPEGIQYESSPELMQEVPDIDTVYFQEVKRPRIENGLTYEDNWLNIRLDAHDSKGINKYWRYEFEEAWQVGLLADRVVVQHDAGNPGSFTFERISITDDKRDCWVTKQSSIILVATTVNSPEDKIKGFTVQSIGPGDARLHIGYSILVKQYSLNRDQYNFWKQLMDANENLGGIYSKVPAPVYGNITSCDGTSKALGYFAASTVRKKRLFIKSWEHDMKTVSAYQNCTYFDYSLPDWIPKSYFGTIAGTNTRVYSTGEFCADCNASGTNVKPDFWQ